jgi:hypothetical protein
MASTESQTMSIRDQIKKWKNDHKAAPDTRLTLSMSKDAGERLERLRTYMPDQNDSELIGLALKLLEQKVDKIYKHKIIKKIISNRSMDLRDNKEDLQSDQNRQTIHKAH